MTPQEEERLLIDMLIGCRNNVARAKAEVDAAKAVQSTMEKQLEETEQAILDYCTGNGVLKFETEHHAIAMSSRESVDVPDDDAVPEYFTRIKREPDKVKIGTLRPQGANWYTIKKINYIKLRSKI